MMVISEKTLDIRAILKSKIGDKIRFVPEFIISWLINISHQDELNEFLWDARDLKGSPWCQAALDRLKNKIIIKGEENLPPKDDGKRYTFVCNHPLGAADGLALGAIIGKKYDDRFRYPVNDLLMSLPGLAPLCIPINKTGKNSRNFPAVLQKGFESEYHILMFPAGLCSRLIDGKVQDIPWTKTFITKSVDTQRDIIPVHFDGMNSPRFYRIAKICSILHLKINIAMLYLSDEMFRNSGKTFTITFGKPIPWETFDKSKNAKQWAQDVRARVYEIADND